MPEAPATSAEGAAASSTAYRGVWFRKCLRLHDNAALLAAVERGGPVAPFFILDPHFDRSRVGINRYAFLLECLRDLDDQLRREQGSRLLVLRGRPDDVLKDLVEGRGPVRLSSLYWEKDSEPYARERDARAETLARSCGLPTESFTGHTLLDLDATIARPGFKPPISMRSIEALVKAAGPVRPPLASLAPRRLAAPLPSEGFEVPKVEELYGEAPPTGESSAGRCFPGGEREALRRLTAVCKDVEYICAFEKPKTSSTGKAGKPWEPSTTGLSPYLKFGCLSVRTAWHAIAECLKGRPHSQPPQSLHGQILFREMFYILGAAVPNFDKQDNNAMCKPIPWGKDEALLAAWEKGATGYPFIDALMRQLHQTGWMHHLGRHAVACFLTRGDLWQSWTAGRDVFDRLLLDADWAVNNGNWLWLAGVAPFSAPFFRVYDPCPGPKSSLNAEQTGEFVRHFVPELKNLPAKYIYKPWTAPLDVQKKAGCIIGKDYPLPIVDHQSARDGNIARFKAALDDMKSGAVPEKFGSMQHDPGPMGTRFSHYPAPAGAASASNGGGRGKGRGRGRGRGGVMNMLLSSSNGQETAEQRQDGKRVNGDAEEASPPEAQRKQRRWRQGGAGGE
eukprot:TRINITY_DN11228_c0_g3_i2.p1 TRINITY_DN11228_c0_g3~~TRINITY_DN11228_c0_g3_i2.p1  ORF type:complete len:620 (-),score=114.43 TRINITY_DN11228_c0_g3_i2:116-1975(-)